MLSPWAAQRNADVIENEAVIEELNLIWIELATLDDFARRTHATKTRKLRSVARRPSPRSGLATS